MLKKIWDWVVVSSADPSKTSLTVKAGLTTIAGLFVTLSPLIHLQFTNETATYLVDLITQLVFYTLTGASALATAYGFARKVYLTLSK